MQPHIEFRNVRKRYRIGKGFPSLRSALTGKGRMHDRYHWAVDGVSFALQPGEALGIIGPNGAGKTTILKLLSRVTKPTEGEIHINGRMSALIELGAGFHPDLSGRENVFLNGAILGMRRDEIEARFDDIVEFAGIGEYLDTPVKRYSSGMYARLGFSIAVHVDPEILLVDEVLAVGDFAFQNKCYARMDELRQKGTSLIFVSHNMEAVRRVCDHGMVMYRGNAIYQGSAAEAVVAYSDALREAAREIPVKIVEEGGLSQRVMTFDAEITGVSLLNNKGEPVTILESGEEVAVAIDVKFNKDVDRPIFSFFIRTPDGKLVYNTTTDWMKVETPCFRAGDQVRAEFHVKMPLLEGNYDLGTDLVSADLRHFYDRLERALGFWVRSSDGSKGLVNLDAQVSFHELVGREAMDGRR